MRGVGVALGLAAVVLMTTGGAAATSYSQESLDQRFRIEFQVTPGPSRPVISGYVYNLYSGLSADRMQLSIERLDAAGQVIGRSTRWVLGGVPPASRAYFSAPVEPAASYRVRIIAFDWIGRGSG